QRHILTVTLGGGGYTVETASNVSQALSAYRNHPADVVLTDLSMPERDGLTLLEELLKLDPEALVILVTAYGTIGSAVQAMKKGAFDYLAKPVDREELLITIARAFERLHLVTEDRQLQQQRHETFRYENIIGHHPLMEEVSRVIKKVATSQATVLITGESGTGKELVARALHVHSPRAHRPFRALNCAAVPETLIESELFGHEKGAFTGAQARRIGLFEAVDQGTLFLDEIGDLSLPLQANLLRVLQEKEIGRSGVRELESVIERAVLLCEAERIDVGDLPAEVRSRVTLLAQLDFELPAEGFSLEGFERKLLETAMTRSNGVIAKAAKMLGLTYKTMQYRLEKFQIGRGAPAEREAPPEVSEERGSRL